jgi:hypothetical protein
VGPDCRLSGSWVSRTLAFEMAFPIVVGRVHWFQYFGARHGRVLHDQLLQNQTSRIKQLTDDIQSPVPELFPFERQNFHAEYQKYFTMKRGNLFRSIVVYHGLWECFQSLDDVWHRGMDDVQKSLESTQMLPSLLFLYAHSRFVVAMELGFSCCIGDAYSVLRGGIEAVAQAHKIHRDPVLTSVWTNKVRGKTEMAHYRQAFEANKETSLFPAEQGLGKLYTFWQQFSNLGPHSGVHSVGKSFEQKTIGKTITWNMHYFETDPQKLALYLLALFQASFQMENAFYSCFETRLKLDDELHTMRGRLAQQKGEEEKHLMQTYKLEELA